MADKNQKFKDALEKVQRNWTPMRERRDGVIFRKWTTHPLTGVRLYAEDYGYRAFPIKIHQTPSRKAPIEVILYHLTPIDSGRKLSGGFKTGDRIRHKNWGPGKILHIDAQSTFFLSDTFGPWDTPTSRAHIDLTHE